MSEPLEPHQQRVVDEKSQLDEKLSNLAAFIALSVTFEELPSEEKLRLQHQKRVMREYSDILASRITAFTK